MQAAQLGARSAELSECHGGLPDRARAGWKSKRHRQSAGDRPPGHQSLRDSDQADARRRRRGPRGIGSRCDRVASPGSWPRRLRRVRPDDARAPPRAGARSNPPAHSATASPLRDPKTDPRRRRAASRSACEPRWRDRRAQPSSARDAGQCARADRGPRRPGGRRRSGSARTRRDRRPRRRKAAVRQARAALATAEEALRVAQASVLSRRRRPRRRVAATDRLSSRSGVRHAAWSWRSDRTLASSGRRPCGPPEAARSRGRRRLCRYASMTTGCT